MFIFDFDKETAKQIIKKEFVFGNGIQYRFWTKNNYFISVILKDGSHGSEQGLFEIGINKIGEETYDTEGWLSTRDVEDYIKEVVSRSK